MSVSPNTPPSENSWAVRLNRWTLVTSQYYLRIVLVVLGVIAGLPIAAPVLMRAGLDGPANLIYSMYSPMCHQFAFRSLFLFGEQSVYPREAAGVPGVRPYEAFVPNVLRNLGDRADRSAMALEMNSKYFVGDVQMGYKVAICQRDMGIYLAMFGVGLLYAVPRVRRYIRPAPVWLYILVGLGPIGLDGFSQLLSYPPFELWPVRETTPLFRFITGALFGAMTAWLAFPYLEASARDVVKEIGAKFNRRKLRTRKIH